MEMFFLKSTIKTRSIYLERVCTIIFGKFNFHVELFAIVVAVLLKTTSPLFKSVRSISPPHLGGGSLPRVYLSFRLSLSQ